MRFDLEQFLALTMALGTAGAVGVGIYSTQQGNEEAVVTTAEAPGDADADDDFPEAEPEPPAAPEPTPPAVTPEPMPALDAAPEVLDQTPGPQVESMRW